MPLPVRSREPAPARTPTRPDPRGNARGATAVLAVALLLVVLPLAGCLGGQTPPADPASDGADGTGDDGGDGGFDTTDPVADDGDGDAPTLAAPPTWEPGRWWRFRLTERFEGATYEATRVVAGQDDAGDHLVGMPTDSFVHEVMVLHVPGFGEVDPDTLGFEVHDCPFEPLRFPIEDGATWQTEFECRPVNATATVESDTVATVELTGQNDHVTLTYDAEAGAIVEMDIEDYGLVEVVEWGTGHEGAVEVPSQHDLVFFHGRIAGVVGTDLLPAPPVETIPIADRYDRVDFILATGSIPVVQDTPNGLYHVRATAPDGTEYEMTTTPADPPGLRFQFHSNDQPSGDWEALFVAGGPGISFLEGIGYTVLPFELPGADAGAATEG